MIYRIIWPLARLASQIYFRKVFLLNVEIVPKRGPLLIVCNHPSSFFEACLLAVMLPRPLYFLTRGDFFKKRIFSWFLRQTHQIPIFRSQDGFGQLRANPDTFAFCYKALSEQKAILIFPESWTVLEKRLRPLQKGAGRLALGALKHIPALNILPVGITFSNPTKFRGTVTIKCGELIPVDAPQDPAEERAVIVQIINKIEKALRGLMIHIERLEREPIFDALQQLKFNDERLSSFPVITAANDFPKEEHKLEAYVNALSDDAEAQLSQKIIAYEKALKEHKLTDRYFVFSARYSFLAKISLVPGAVVLLLGKAIYALPTWWIQRFVNAKVTKLPYYGPIKWMMGMLLLSTWILLCLLVGYVIGGLTGMLVMFTWAMLGYITLTYFHDIGFRGFFTPLTLSRQSKSSLQELRSAIIDFSHLN